MLPLAKTLDMNDYRAPELASALQIVDCDFHREMPQHHQRRWEYAMALRAMGDWCELTARGSRRRPQNIYDIGGAGSPFRHMMDGISVIDPSEPDGFTLEQFATAGTELSDAVFCLSVLEHIKESELERFLYHLSSLVAPGGLLFLTADYTEDVLDEPHDTYHFHWMREQIFTASTWGSRVVVPFLLRDFLPFGVSDWTTHGPQVYDYTFVAQALIKRK